MLKLKKEYKNSYWQTTFYGIELFCWPDTSHAELEKNFSI